MLVLTAAAIGVMAVGTRSVLGCVLCGCLILAIFGLSALLSAGSVSAMSLLIAVLGYNAGIASTLGLSLITETRRRA